MHPTAVVSPDARIGADVRIGAFTVVHPGVELGAGSVVASHCVLGEPNAALLRDPSHVNPPLRIGDGAVIRSMTILYAGSTIGEALETGHHVTIREGATIGRNLRIGTQCDVQGHCTIGDWVRMHSGVQVNHGSRIGDFVWLFPGVMLANDPHPPSEEIRGVTIEAFAAVGARAVVLPGVTIGRDALVGAGSVVTKDVPAETAVVGNPARPRGSVLDIRNRRTGEAVYPWRHHFDRGMPWQGVGYDAWEKARG